MSASREGASNAATRLPKNKRSRFILRERFFLASVSVSASASALTPGQGLGLSLLQHRLDGLLGLDAHGLRGHLAALEEDQGRDA